VLVAESPSSINKRIIERPSAELIEIPLPDHQDRKAYMRHFRDKHGAVKLAMNQQRFIDDTAGLTLAGIRDLLQEAHNTGEKVTSSAIIALVNVLLERMLGESIQIIRPDHGPDDVLGYELTKNALGTVFRRCEDPNTAISVMVLSGPNGGGKTYQGEAFANASGRVVIKLAGIRSKWFGDTDRLFERLRMYVAIYGKVLIMVDEAHTAIGSVHQADGHETEKRLSGNIIAMMSDKKLLGKVVWCLMTSRPDLLDPDILSRSSVQIPILDLEGEDRADFVRMIFARKKIQISDEELTVLVEATAKYSNRDYDHFVKETLAQRRDQSDISPLQVLDHWSAPTDAIEQDRQMQTLIAVLHCSYPKLRPEKLADLEQVRKQLERLRLGLAA
jgi:SpoVK/Ycf46/Vps4 family AAA+-type ATPase